MGFLLDMLQASWHLLADASIYILFGILVGGLLKVFLSPATLVVTWGRVESRGQDVTS